MKRFCIVIFFAAILFAIPLNALSQNYPSKPITCIVPYGPGGGFDSYMRAIAKVLPKYLPNKVATVVKNVPGAGSRTGVTTLYRSKADGHTIGIMNINGLIALDLVKETKNYDLMKFTYLGVCARDIAGIFVSANSKFHTIKDLQEADQVKFGTTGVGALGMSYANLAQAIMHFRVHYVSGYKSSPEYIVAAIRGDTDAVTTGTSTTELAYVKAGELRPVVMFTIEPWEYYPEAPTLKGTPYEELAEVTTDRIIAAPPGVPSEITKVLEEALIKTLKDEEMVEWGKKTNHPLSALPGKTALDSITKQKQLFQKYKDAFKIN
jgi:tripartite-type tricarboxylate transporter receptor subunit TctC